MRLAALSILSIAVLTAAASAQNGSWSQAGSGSVWNWGDTANWTGGVVADGANNSAVFATAGLNTSVLINLDTPRTIGSLVFDNPTNSFGWTIQGGNTLTLSNSVAPTIAINNAAITCTIAVPLAGAFTKTGPGTLALTGNNTNLSGGITVSAGVLGVTTNGSTNPLGTGTVTLNGGTLRLGDVTGSNQRMVIPAGTTFATSGITATMDDGAQTPFTGYTWYAQGQNTMAPSAGLPMGATITGPSNNSYTLPVANGIANDTLLLDSIHATGKLVLGTPAKFGTISFLTSSANPGNTLPTVTVTLHYTDGTPDAPGSMFVSPDWLGGAGGFGRISAAGYAAGGNLFERSVTNPNPAHLIGSMDLSWLPGTNAGAHTVILALSGGPGLPIPVLGGNPAQAFANNVLVTADSAIDVRTSAGATLGNLSIGANTLTVTSGLQGSPSLTVGGVAMTGSPTFNVGGPVSPTTLITTGAFTDGGVRRTITKTGFYSLTVAGASPGLQPGTVWQDSNGILNLNNAAGFGPSPTVYAYAGLNASVNLLPGINPSFAYLGGDGTVNLNGNILTLGGTAGIDFAGVIADGSPAGGVLFKTGPGFQTLEGANSYTGGTNIAGGKLNAANAFGSATGTGPVTIADGGTLADGNGGASFTDGVRGFISGPVTVQTGGSVSPGFLKPGVLTLRGGVNFNSGSTFAVYLGTANPRTGVQAADVNTNSRVVTPLDVLFGGSLVMSIDGGGQSFSVGNRYDYFVGRDDGVMDSLPTNVTFVPTDFAVSVHPGDFTLSRSADGLSLILTFTPVPEPGTFALIAAAAGALLERRRFMRLL
jgi:autotransporter-associated beta strand protein